jgi:extradiol dioxygenase family protein
MPRVKAFDLYAGAASATTQSDVFFTGDATEVTLQLKLASASTTTVEGSNVTGFRTAIAADDWSTLTTVIAAADQFLNIEPGFRWIRCSRASNNVQRAILGVYGLY